MEGEREQWKERGSGKGITAELSVKRGGVNRWVQRRKIADLGAWELQSTWVIFLKQPLVKGLTPPRNFPVTYGEEAR